MGFTITDTHWSERGRCGRTIAFLARMLTDGHAALQTARAIACDERTAVCIDENGAAVVFGDDNRQDFAYFFSCNTLPDRCTSGQTLHWLNGVTVYKVKGTTAGTNGFDLNTWTGNGGQTVILDVSDGVLTPDIQTAD